MLTHLSLKDFVIVKELNLDLASGLTVLTGETGAGKSILIDAIQQILGARSDTGMIREGAKQTDLTAIFEINDDVLQILRDQALIAEDDLLEKTAIIRRVIDRNGRSRSWINGIAVTISQVKELATKLLDIHGQNAQQSLLKPSGQLALLDAFGSYTDELAATRKAFYLWQQAQKRLFEAKEDAKKLADEAERLAWVHEELSQIRPIKGEWEELNAEHRRLGNAHDILDALESASGDLSDSDESALSLLGRNTERLQALAQYDEKLGDIANQLNDAQAIVEDAVRELDRYRDRTDLDEGRFEEVDARVSLYFNAARKFHTLPEDLFEKFEETTQKLKALQQNLDLETLEKEEEVTHSAYLSVARTLSKKRHQAAKMLSKQVTDAMQMLSMAGGCFEAKLNSSEPGALGLESCEFLVAGHPGVPARALSKVASGGELSRISLAISVITSKQTPVDTLIFDEVDAGIGGAVADVVGKLLKKLSLERQVMCVTHLPQVASYGYNHLRVQKSQENGQTVSKLQLLNDAERVEELARMLAGADVTIKARDNAAELIENARAYQG